MANPWFRLYTDFLDDPKIISLAFEDQRHFIGLLCLKSAGLLDSGASEQMQNRIVAQRLWIDFGVILDVKKRLISADLIDDDWQPVAWNKRQFVSDHDISGAERQRKHREKQRNALRNVTRNGAVTLPDTDTDTDTDTEKTKAAVATLPVWLANDAWYDFIEHRKHIKAPMSKRAEQLAITELEKLYRQGINPVEVIHTSILNGWRGLFAPKAQAKQTKDDERAECIAQLTGYRPGRKEFEVTGEVLQIG